MKSAEDVIRFWFVDHGESDWWAGAPEFDAEIAGEFGETHEQVSKGEGFTWRGTAEGRLAEIIVLDQFSRQLYRGQARAFAQDGMALVLAQELVDRGLDRDLLPALRNFAFMPYMHSESLVVHEVAVQLFHQCGEEALAYEMGHYEAIRRFGRFPKRNAALGRTSTPEERAYLAEAGDRAF